jgi:hypothetical protein
MKDVPESVQKSLQRWSTLIAINVRNRMENFHSEHLSDAQMKELNPIIRNAIYESLHAIFLLKRGHNESQRLYGARNVSYWLLMAPSYWEQPRLPNDVAERLGELKLRELRKLPCPSSERSRREFEEFCVDDISVFD